MLFYPRDAMLTRVLAVVVCLSVCLSVTRLHSKSQPTDDTISLKGVWSRHVTHFKFLVPLKYLWNGLSYRLQIFYTGWPCVPLD